MFEKVADAEFIRGEHEILKFWSENNVFDTLRKQNEGKPKWSFLDGPITANNPMGVHHAWGRTYKDAYQRYFAMTGHELRYQNGFDCQGLWVEVEVEKELNLGTKNAINEFGIDKFVNECKKRVLRFAARQTEQSMRLGFWMEWDNPDNLRRLAETIGSDEDVTLTMPTGANVTDKAHQIVAKLGNPEWGGSYFTFSTENNETIWTFLKKCFTRGKIYRGYDVMPWSGRGGSAYSQMEVADGRKLAVHKSCFVRFPIKRQGAEVRCQKSEVRNQEAGDRGQEAGDTQTDDLSSQSTLNSQPSTLDREYLLVWTTTPWTLTSNVAAAVNPDLDYVKLRSKRDDAVYYFAKDNLNFQRLSREFKEGFGRPEWSWPENVPKLKTIGQIFKEQGGYEIEFELDGKEMVGWEYEGPFDDLPAQQTTYGRNPNKLIEACERRLNEITTGVDLTLRHHFFSGFIFEIRQVESTPLYDPKALVNDVERELPQDLQNWGVHGIDSSLIDSSPKLPDKEWAAQTNKLFHEIIDKAKNFAALPSSERHLIIDGGRDNKGKPNVVAGEGSGIVHIAPGCGDVDYKSGTKLDLPIIAPLIQNGTFEEGFGDFTGKEAIDPNTAELVFEKLREKQMLVNVEQYPHIYPHCWRTGDELVFRLVDEWFINMDWREEIKEVTSSIRWLPDSVGGQKLELEWLSNMRDWMISKKRFWGLALPIWYDEETGDFEVIGSLAELKERAVEGWDEFEGHTPHRPWIDNVKIKHSKTGNLMSRIVDVGNPWLDAGIVSFSTMHYNTDREEWQKWYPADFVTECFPGQFRNWFYSLLSLATMMNYDDDERKDDPLKKRPFKTLLGHRLVTNEQGKPMHKTDGTAIWFEEAAEQIGVDTIRWMYLAHNPASDLRFGTRYHEKPVTLQTPDGPVTETKEGLPVCVVTSKPADEIRRQILIPLWNSYAFFVNYARLDEFDPHSEPVPVPERPEIDRWILSNLQALIVSCRNAFEEFDSAQACLSAANFIDDLSNWYIRRNRRRFWRSRKEGATAGSSSSASTAGWDPDKLAAYQTLYEVLVTLSKLLAPMMPFLAERMYQNLVCRGEGEAPAEPQSVHLCEYPHPDDSLLDDQLNASMAIAQLVVKMGHKLREESSQRVRQPLAELRYACGLADQKIAVESLAEVIKEELNIKQITACDNLDDLVSYSYKPNLKTLGPKYGKLIGALRKQLPEMDPNTLAPLRSGQSVTISIEGTKITLEPDDVLISTEQAADWFCADDRGIQIALSTVLTPELVREGMRNDFIRQVQNLRKEADLEIQDRINIFWFPADDSSPEAVSELTKAIEEWADYIKGETLADSITRSPDVPPSTNPVKVGEIKLPIWIEKV